MSAVWSFLAKYAVQFALWAVKNPAQAEADVTQVKSLADEIKAAKK